MAKYYVDLVDMDGNILETEEETFTRRKDAEWHAQVCDEGFSAGADLLELMGEDYFDPAEYRFEVRKG